MDIVERLRPHGLMGQSAETRLMQEAADEIERLQEEHHDVRILNEQYYNENAILTDEIERLRKEIELLHIRIDYYVKVLVLRDDIHQKDSE